MSNKQCKCLFVFGKNRLQHFRIAATYRNMTTVIEKGESVIDEPMSLVDSQ